MFTASMVIAICKALFLALSRSWLTSIDWPFAGGDLFVEDAERRAMMDILIKTDVDLAWPTAGEQAYLRHKWAWE